MERYFELSPTQIGALLTIRKFHLTLASAASYSTLLPSAEEQCWIKHELSSFSNSNFIHFESHGTSVALTSENDLVFFSTRWPIERLPLSGLDSNESQWIVDIPNDDEEFLVVQNLNDGKSEIRSTYVGVHDFDYALQLESSVTSVGYSAVERNTFLGLYFLTLKNGDFFDYRLDYGPDKIIRYNLPLLKDKSHDELQNEPLENGNALLFFKNDDGKIGYIHYDRINRNTEGVYPFNFGELEVDFSPTVEIIGSKLAYTKGLKTYVVKIDESNGEIANQFTLPTDAKYVPVNNADFIVFVKNHNLEFHSSSDLSLLFTIENVPHCGLTYSPSLKRFFLLTEYHLRVIDAQEGLELESFFVGPEPLSFEFISKFSEYSLTHVSHCVFKKS